MAPCRHSTDCSDNYYCDRTSKHCEHCITICKPSIALPNFCKQECPNYKYGENPSPDLHIITPSASTQVTTISVLNASNNSTTNTAATTVLIAITVTLALLIVAMTFIAICIIRYYYFKYRVPRDAGVEEEVETGCCSKVRKCLCCECKYDFIAPWDGVINSEHSNRGRGGGRTPQFSEYYNNEDLNYDGELPGTSKEFRTKWTGDKQGSLSSAVVESSMSYTESGTNDNTKHSVLKSSSNSSQDTKNIHISNKLDSEKNTDTNTDSVFNSHCSININSLSSSDNQRLSHTHTQTDNPTSIAETQTDDFLIHQTKYPYSGSSNEISLHPQPSSSGPPLRFSIEEGATGRGDTGGKPALASRGDSLLESIDVRLDGRGARGVIQDVIQSRDPDSVASCTDDDDDTTAIKQVERLSIPQQETTPFLYPNTQISLNNAYAPPIPETALEIADNDEKTSLTSSNNVATSVERNNDVYPRHRSSPPRGHQARPYPYTRDYHTDMDIALRVEPPPIISPASVHPNRRIYEKLKQIDWIQGYFSEGQSIEVYIDFDQIDPHSAIDELVRRTGERPEKFKIQHEDFGEDDSVRFGGLR